jgi:hypothetical protein
MAHPPITSPRTVSSAPVCGEKVNNIKYYWREEVDMDRSFTTIPIGDGWCAQ